MLATRSDGTYVFDVGVTLLILIIPQMAYDLNLWALVVERVAIEIFEVAKFWLNCLNI